MIYVCSDLHGRYDRYMKLLETIGFSADDTLYILGDVIDRGSGGIAILQHMMQYENIIPFMGNHEFMMLMYLYGYDKRRWLLEANGGHATKAVFEQLAQSERKKIIDYIDRSWTVKNLMINNHRYSLSHIGIFPDTEDRRAFFTAENTDVYELQKQVWGQDEFRKEKIASYPEELCPTVFLSGHVMTYHYHNKDEIYVRKYDNGCIYVDLDCGCAMGDERGNLACVRIDENTGEIDLEHPIAVI